MLEINIHGDLEIIGLKNKKIRLLKSLQIIPYKTPI